ncbi:MAG TPA: zinc-ribbon domain-containing protein [Thermomicrobiales bacterium]|nr:zinc-ribbon domain-containing protein [Thermomicrobiales bacterium]
MTICRQCGTRNPDDAAYCASCGAPLREREDGEPTIIDVSDGDSEVVIEDTERDRSFSGTYIGPARVYVTSSGNRGCLIIVAVVLLAVCCVCVGWWTVADNIFF